MIWLRAYLFGAEPGPSGMAWRAGPRVGADGVGGRPARRRPAAGSVRRAPGALTPFRIALAVVFGYLAIQAIRNANLFGLAAGYVLAGNLGEWAAELSAGAPRRARVGPGCRPSRGWRRGRPWWCRRPADRRDRLRAGSFRATGERRVFGLGASPLAYAHDAGRSPAGRGSQSRAWGLGLRQAGVYVSTMAPAKVFMDGRMGVPDRETFETYVRLDGLLAEGRPGWGEVLRASGNPCPARPPGHSGAEATLLVDPEWRCITTTRSARFSSRGTGAISSRRFRPSTLRLGIFTLTTASRQTGPPRPWGLGEAKGLYSAGVGAAPMG